MCPILSYAYKVLHMIVTSTDGLKSFVKIERNQKNAREKIEEFGRKLTK